MRELTIKVEAEIGDRVDYDVHGLTGSGFVTSVEGRLWQGGGFSLSYRVVQYRGQRKGRWLGAKDIVSVSPAAEDSDQ